MKFLSKRINYRVTLKSGISAEPQTGRASVPGLYVKFNNNEVTITEDMARRLGLTIDQLITMMKNHRGYGTDGDFIAVDDEKLKDQVDNFKKVALINSSVIEPEHDIFELGGKNLNPKPMMRFTSDQQKLLNSMAVDMARKMAPQLASEMLKMMVEQKQKEQKDEITVENEAKEEIEEINKKIVKKRGRPLQKGKPRKIDQLDKTEDS